MRSASITFDVEATRIWAEAICREVAARDVGNTPFYVLLASRLVSLWTVPDWTYGIAFEHMDLVARSVIGDTWQGRGIAIVVNDRILADELRPFDANLFNDLFLGICIHELAHFMTFPTIPNDRIQPLDFEVLCAAAFLQKNISVGPNLSVVGVAGDQDYDSPPWLWHEAPTFCRAAIHLLHRLEAPGRRLPATAVWTGALYSMSRADRYAAALAAEVSERESWPIRLILLTPIPAAFAAIWESDQACWFSTLKERSNLMSSNALRNLESQLGEVRRQNEAAYLRIVREVCDGESPNAAVVMDVLATAGKTVADLTADVGLTESRRRLRIAVDKAGAARLELRELEAHLADELSAFGELHATHALRVAGMNGRIEAVQAILRAAKDGERQLRETIVSPHLRLEMHDVGARLEALGRSADQKRRELDAKRSEIQGLQSLIGDNDTSPGRKDEYKTTARRKAGMADDLERELKHLERDIAALKLRHNALNAEALQP